MFKGFAGRVIRSLTAAAMLFATGGALALAQNLVANPLLSRDLPPPGWLATHHDEWVAEHPIYQATCESADVTKEVHFLNRLIAYDEYLLSLSTTPDPDNPAATQLAKVARQSAASLRRDVVVADALVVQLQLLPPCDGDKPAMPVAASAVPMPSPIPAAVVPAPAIPPPTAAVETKPTPPAAGDRLMIRFDDKVAALTPSGIRAFNQAVAAAHAGQSVRLTIEGCESSADFTRGSPCARRLYSLENRLQEAGIKNPERLFAATP